MFECTIVTKFLCAQTHKKHFVYLAQDTARCMVSMILQRQNTLNAQIKKYSNRIEYKAFFQTDYPNEFTNQMVESITQNYWPDRSKLS